VADVVSAIVHGEGTIPYLRDAPPSYNGPYYLAAHMWLTVTGLDPDEWGLRLLSLAASAGAMVLFTAAATRLAGAAAGLVAGLVAASNPFVVQFAAEARGYGLALLATAAAALGLARWLDDRAGDTSRARGALVLYGVAAAAAGLAHWFALLVVAGLALAAVILRGRRAVPLVAVTAVAALPTVGLVAIALLNGVGASGAEWIGAVGLGAPRRLLEAWAGSSMLLLVVTLVAAAAGLLLTTPTQTRTPRSVRAARARAARVVAAAWIAVPVVVVTVVGLVRPVFVARYLLPATLGLALLVAFGLRRLPRIGSAIATASVVVLSVVVTLGLVARGPTEDVRGAVRAVASAHQPGEPVVAAARWDALGLDHYARRDHPALVPDMVLPPAAIPPASTVWVVRRAREGVQGDGAKLAALDGELEKRGLRIAEETSFDGRASDVLVQRWEPARPG
jgi:hypothetical protein